MNIRYFAHMEDKKSKFRLEKGMSVEGINDRLWSLRNAKDIYLELVTDATSELFDDKTIKTFLKKINFEVNRLEELVYNRECEND